ncbi:MAG TPA: capsular biosynthesis protein [Anaerolineae bacterium]|nr:capsular biosynthesis protein [Anaerolineae bacterium]HOR00364.1 capsular biosynthesis protein [Anaerolineae bacterium]HPL28518.1 capsular biosynthesis protein [Anaerolineae bacterium]
MDAAAARLTDLHCHILPDVDDGPADLAGALGLARAALDDGIATVAATPHNLMWRRGLSCATLEARVAELQRCLEEHGLSLRVVPGAETALITALPQQIDAGQAAPLNHSRYLLVEPPPWGPPPPLQDLIFQVQVRGLVPILAHPERNDALARRLDLLQSLVERGTLVQITAGSLEGAFGQAPQEAAWRMLAAGLVHVIATDAHDTSRRPPRLSKAEALAATVIGAERAHALVAANPAAILNDQQLELEPPPPPQKHPRWFWQR